MQELHVNLVRKGASIDIAAKITTSYMSWRIIENTEGVYRPPSDSTFYRVLSKIDTHHLDRIVGDWLLKQEISTLERLAVDGKTLRGSSRADGKPLQLLSAVTHHLRLTLAQVPIDKKSNEMPASPKLIRDLPPIEHTVDAEGRQKEKCRDALLRHKHRRA